MNQQANATPLRTGESAPAGTAREHRQPGRSRGVFSLGLVLYVVTVLAIFFSAFSELSGLPEATWTSLFLLLSVGGAVGALIGLLCGACQGRGWRHTMLVGLGGILIGGMANLLTLLPIEESGRRNAITYGGFAVLICWVLIAERYREADDGAPSPWTV
ncbi:MAG: hypothetical protein KatS3mg111_1636 [Pirellulaceae bacterium]|nr:MAG: hypothetical protein KatS3mg111_1636 [Pirellulaceae bacterium]